MNSLDSNQIDRYKRQIALDEIGYEGQERICAGSVLIVGTGGLGSAAAMYLAAAGIGTIGIADGDTVDVSNLQRQIIHFNRDVGRLKVESAAEKISAINPTMKIRTVSSFLDSDALAIIAPDYDCVIDATDNISSKLMINDTCVKVGIPLVHAGIDRFSGELMTILPGRSACYHCMFNCRTLPQTTASVIAGPLGPVAGVVGTLQAVECLKIIAEIPDLLTNRLLIIDCLGMKFRTVQIKRRESCPVCGNISV